MSLLNGLKILVVEDEPLVLLDIRNQLQEQGAIVTTASKLDDALRLCDEPELAAAILDHKLRDSTTSAVCTRLGELELPFVVYTGYIKLEGACSVGELVQKPAPTDKLVSAVLEAIRKQPRAA